MEVSGQLHVSAALLLRKEPPVPTGYEAGWDPEPFWMLWIREKSLASAGKAVSLHNLKSTFLIILIYNDTTAAFLKFST
jgi:hypothetical protein